MRRIAALVGVLMMSAFTVGCMGNFSRIPRPARVERAAVEAPGAPRVATANAPDTTAKSY